MSVSSRLDRLGEIVSDLSQQVQHGPEQQQQQIDYPVEDATQDLEAEASDFGHLYKGAQTKSKYLSPTSFALISEEVKRLSTVQSMIVSHIHSDIGHKRSLTQAATLSAQSSSGFLDTQF